ncbi:MAG TPA: C25 family cysteine peptidase, partial [Melioribacteraceae bacterium]|nr:C25 family cysteine peptidase [Melioribacteraceae bacterium]
YREYLDRYSDTTAYWLTWGGDNGLRVDTVSNYSNSPIDTIDYYDEFLHFEQNPWLDYTLEGGMVRREDPYWHENETWNWWGQGVGIVSQAFSTTNVYPNKIARGYAKFQSYATNLSQNSHITALKINNHPTAYDSGFVNKYEVKTLKAEFSSSLLVNGTNNLRIVSYATQSTVNRLFGDWREIEYPRYLLAKNDTLTFRYTSLPENGAFGLFKLGNVVTTDNVIYKYLGNYKFKKITNFTKNGNFINFIDTVKNKEQYILRTSQTIKKPIFYYKKQFEDLLSTQNEAEYVLITHPFFLTKAQEYADMVSSAYNVTTKVINVFDIYDQLNYGFFAPEPIKEFLKSAYNNWQAPKIKNVFIVGRANYDYYGYKSKYQGAPIDRCLVPSFGAPVSDTWFVIWDETGANIPQINIGRLPVRNITEFESYMSKHQNYLISPYDNWNKKFLFFSGGNFTDPNEINTLKGINDFIVNNYVKPNPIGGDAAHFYKTVDPITSFGPFSHSYIQEKIDAGSLLISYIGHSGTQTWDNSITDPIQLRNLVNRSPLITDFGCSTARFAEPDITSFSELFVNGLSGQAIGYIGNSSLGFTSTSYTAPKLFYEKLLVDTVFTIGDAHRLTKLKLLSTYGSTGTYRLFSFTNLLVGDPIIKIKFPPMPNLLSSNQNFTLIGNLSDDADSVLFKFDYFNLGLAISDTFKIKVQHIYNSQIINENTFIKVLPLFSDSLNFYIKTKNLTGEHKIVINLDSENRIDEIYENDNDITIAVNIYSSSFRSLFVNPIQNQINSSLNYLNSTQNSNSNRLKIKFSKYSNFSYSDSLLIPLGTLFTKVNFSNYYSSDRLWLKAKPEFGTEFGTPISFLLGSKDAFSFIDSLSFVFEKNLNLSFNLSSISLDTLRFNFYALSAGFNAGRTAIIAINGQNLVPENTLRGFNICRFNKTTLEYIEYKRFDISSGVAANNIFIAYLDSIPSNEIVVIAVTDDAGQGLTTALRTKLKEFGSRMIDSFGYRYSWALIGYKGAPIGSVPEGLKAPFNGKVEIDTTITRMPLYGGFVTTELGPVAKWKDFEVNQSVPEGASIKYQIIGVKENNTI